MASAATAPSFGIELLNEIRETYSFLHNPADRRYVDYPGISGSTDTGLPAEDALRKLSAVVDAIREARPLPAMSPDIDSLLTQAVAAQGTPEDVTAWAHQLAEDIANLTD